LVLEAGLGAKQSFDTITENTHIKKEGNENDICVCPWVVVRVGSVVNGVHWDLSLQTGCVEL
jgi:hypothetical protein